MSGETQTERHLDYIHFLESMRRIDEKIRLNGNIEEMLGEVLEVVLSVLECDRAWLLFPCDPDSSVWRVSIERTRPEYPGELVIPDEFPMTSDVAARFRDLLTAIEPVTGESDPGESRWDPEDKFAVRSMMSIALHPEEGKPWEFCVHQCVHAREWSARDRELFTEIGRRISDGLSNMLFIHTKRQSDEQLSRLLDNARDMLFRLSVPDGQYEYVNQASMAITGYTPEEIIASPMHIRKVIHPDWKEYVEEQWQNILNGDVPNFIEYQILDRFGNIKWLQQSNTLVKDDQGTVIAVEGIVTDVSERKAAAEILRMDRIFADKILQSIPGLFYILEEGSSKFIRRNANWANVTGYSDIELNEMTALDIVADKELCVLRMREALTSGSSAMENALLAKTGERIPYYFTGDRIDIDGKIYLVGVGVDISKRKWAEEALEKRIVALTQPLDDVESIHFEELFNLEDIQRLQEDFSAATGVASIITRVDGTPITQPSNFCRLCNDIIRKTEKGRANCLKSDAALGCYNPDGPNVQECMSSGLWDAGAAISVGGKHIATWLIGQVRNDAQTEENMREYARAIEADEESIVEAFREVPSMSQKQFRLLAQVVYTFASQLSSSAYQNVQQARFITERKQAEEEKARLEEQCRQAQKMESVGRLAGGVAHDFNNMLSVILGHAEIAMQEMDSSSQLYEDLQGIQMAALRSADLTRQLLAFARKQTVSPRVLDLNETVSGMLKMVQRLIGEGIDLLFKPGDGVWQIMIDPTQIDQLLANLCVNARDAIDGVGKITIETENVSLDREYCDHHSECIPGDFVKLSVSDNGCGMSPDILSNIFEPFYTTKEVGEGTGLGLATVYGIVKQSKGFITAYSEPEHGTTFRIFLPGQNELTEEIKMRSVEKPATGGTETVLLVEDEVAILNIGKIILGNLGYTVLVAATPAEAITIAGDFEDEIDLLVTDVIMPEMNGLDLAKELLGLYPEMKQLFISGYTANVLAHHDVHNENINFMQKPFSQREIATKVREALDGG